MKKKYIFIPILILFLLVGCARVDKEESKLELARKDYIEVLEKVNDERIVVRFANDDKEVSYYVYTLKNDSYTQKLITLHKDENSYNQAKELYKVGTIYNLITESDLLITEVTLQKDKRVEKDVRKFILNKYKDKEDFEVLD